MVQKKMAMWNICKKYDRAPHHKSRTFFASQGLGLSLDTCLSRKALKRVLQNIYLTLDLLYNKHNPLFTIAVDGSISKKNNITCKKKLVKDIIFTKLLQW